MKIIKDSLVNFENERGTYHFAPNLTSCYIWQFSNSKITLVIDHNINLLFVHQGNNFQAEVEFILTQPKTKVVIREIALTQKTQTFRKKVIINHLAPQTISDYYFCGLGFENSLLSIEAKSAIKNGMIQAEAHQMLRILIANQAQATGQPGLYIDDYDVKASHGNAIGQINEREIYYLQTKGLTKQEARWVIIESYILTALKILDQTTQKVVLAKIKAKLP